MYYYDKDVHRMMTQKKIEILKELDCAKHRILKELSGVDKITLTRLRQILDDYNQIEYDLTQRFTAFENKILLMIKDSGTDGESIAHALDELKEELENTITTNRNEVDQIIEDTCDYLDDKINTLSTQVTANTEAIKAIGAVDGGEGLGEIASNVSLNTERLTALEPKVEDNTTDINTLELKVLELLDVGSDIDSMQDSIATNAQNIANNAQNIATNAQDIATNAQDIANNAEDIESLRNDVDNKQDVVTGAITNVTNTNLQPDIVAISDGNGKIGSSSTSCTKLGYLNNVTSDIQTQLNNLSTSLNNKSNTSHNHDNVYLNVDGDSMNGYLNTQNVYPPITNTYNIGDSTRRYKSAYLNNIYATNMFMYNNTQAIKGANNRITFLASSTGEETTVELGIVNNTWAMFPYRKDYSWTLGAAGDYRWGDIYAKTTTINTSDKNEKNTIEELDLKKSLEFINEHTPVSFKFNDGTSGRTHYGLIAQDVENILAKLGMTSKDFAGFIKSEKTKRVETGIDENGNKVYEDIPVENEYNYGLRYSEYIAPLIASVKYLSEQNEKLKSLLVSKGVITEKEANEI